MSALEVGPAQVVEILLGKYFAVLAVYTIALAFSVTHVLVLAWIGDPDSLVNTRSTG